MAVDIGAEAVNRASSRESLFTYINFDHPATVAGEITSIDIWASSNISGLRVGTFYKTNGNTLKCRDSDTITGTITAGSKVNKATSLNVEIGDYIGCHFTGGGIEKDGVGFDGVWNLEADLLDPNDEATYSVLADDAISLGGYIEEPGNVTVTPLAANLILTTYAPIVTATGDRVVTPTTANLILTTYAPTVSVSTAGWLGTWAKRVKVTIDSGDIDSDLTDFPVLVYISASSGINSEDISFVFDELTSDGNRKKIAVTKSDGTTELYVEIEKWDDASEEAWLWVKVSGAASIASGSDTDLYLYYDSTEGDNDAYVGDTNDVVAENVWDSNFKLVDHMRDGADNAHTRDSTSNDNDGAKTGANAPAVTVDGIAESQDFDGSDDEIAIPYSVELASMTDITIEAWIKPNGPQPDTYSTIVRKDAHPGATTRTIYDMDLSSGYLRLTFMGSGNSSLTIGTSTTTDLRDDQWHHVAIVRDDTGNNAYAYVNGVAEVTVGSDSANGNFASVPTIQTDVGQWDSDGTNRRFAGLMDELRISSTARSAAWLAATYETSIDHLLDWGSEEEIPAVGDIDTPAKRRMAAGIVPFHSVIIPDGTIGLKDRMQIACLYSENAVATPAGVPAHFMYYQRMRRA